MAVTILLDTTTSSSPRRQSRSCWMVPLTMKVVKQKICCSSNALTVTSSWKSLQNLNLSVSTVQLNSKVSPLEVQIQKLNHWIKAKKTEAIASPIFCMLISIRTESKKVLKKANPGSIRVKNRNTHRTKASINFKIMQVQPPRSSSTRPYHPYIKTNRQLVCTKLVPYYPSKIRRFSSVISVMISSFRGQSTKYSEIEISVTWLSPKWQSIPIAQLAAMMFIRQVN
jgi:hypothetical protein